jgi:hypothetical protein
VRTHLLRHIRHKIPPVEGSQRAEHEILRLRVVVAAGPSLSRLKHSLESSCVVLCCVVLCCVGTVCGNSRPARPRQSAQASPLRQATQASKHTNEINGGIIAETFSDRGPSGVCIGKSNQRLLLDRTRWIRKDKTRLAP